MNDQTQQAAEPDRTINDARQAAETAPGRCVMYALFSDVAASPFDAEPAVDVQLLNVGDLNLPYELTNLEQLLQDWQGQDPEQLKREYSGLFEVGSDGPPVPIREDLHLNQPAGVREDIVRFYEYFGYGLSEKFAWAPDHLSVELEFMHFLCFQEVDALNDGEQDSNMALSFQLAQSDFSQRHLCNWVSGLAHKVVEQQPESIYAKLLAAMSEFVVKDFQWQQATIN